MESFIGEIKFFAFNFVPRGYAQCNGAQLAIGQNQALYALLGSKFGGDAKTVFNLPDLRGRAMVAASVAGNAPPPHYPIGTKVGVEAVKLTPTQVPTHTHAVTGVDIPANKAIPTGFNFANSVPAKSTVPPNPPYTSSVDPTQLVALSASSISVTGGAEPHQNMQPSLALMSCIAMQGYFPPRD